MKVVTHREGTAIVGEEMLGIFWPEWLHQKTFDAQVPPDKVFTYKGQKGCLLDPRRRDADTSPCHMSGCVRTTLCGPRLRPSWPHGWGPPFGAFPGPAKWRRPWRFFFGGRSPRDASGVQGAKLGGLRHFGISTLEEVGASLMITSESYPLSIPTVMATRSAASC